MIEAGGPPPWMGRANGRWYRTERGLCLRFPTPSGPFEIRSLSRGWQVDHAAAVHRCRNFAELLEVLGREGPAALPADRAPDPVRVAAESALEEGFAAELLWWMDLKHFELSINGIEFDRVVADAPCCPAKDGVLYAELDYYDDYLVGTIPYYRIGSRIIEYEWEAGSETLVGLGPRERQGVKASAAEWREHFNGHARLRFVTRDSG